MQNQTVKNNKQILKEQKEFIKTLNKKELKQALNDFGYESLKDFYADLYLDADGGCQACQDLIDSCNSSMGKDFL